MSGTIWITWEEQRRNKPIAEEVNAKFFQLSEIWKHSRYIRYLIGSWKTFRILKRENPDSVIVQNPSIVLATVAILLRPFFKYKLGTDTHNSGFCLESDFNSPRLEKIGAWIQRNADFVIAHNDGLKAQVDSRGGDVIALPDKVPVIEKPDQLLELEGKLSFLFICTFSPDEPWQDVLTAFEDMPEYHVYVTGNYSKVGLQPGDVPANIHLLGRIPWDEFDQMLYSADSIIDLTTRDNCLLCGAYEAVAAETPLILSNTDALRSYFRKGAQYATNNVCGIQRAVLDTDYEYDNLKTEIVELKKELADDWQQRVLKLKIRLA